MKNTFLYYLLIIVPLVPFVYMVRTELIGTTWIIIYFFSYLLIYRSFTDFYRLKSKGILKNKDFLKLFIPGSIPNYFTNLYT
jgi:hypothetical protein